MSLITGAGFDVGHEMIKFFAREGSSLILADHSVKTTEAVAVEVEAARGRAIACWLASGRASYSTGATFVAGGGHTAG